MSGTWHYAHGGLSVGPLSLEELGNALRSFERPRNVLVWRQGMANWTRAGDASELSHLFDTPPPLPAPTAPPPIPDAMPGAKEGPPRSADAYGPDLFSQYRQVTPTVIARIKVASFIIAVAVIYVLNKYYSFDGGWEWGAIALGIVAYVVAKAALSLLIGYVWGIQDAKELREALRRDRQDRKRHRRI